jgi:hypothetical protein
MSLFLYNNLTPATYGFKFVFNPVKHSSVKFVYCNEKHYGDIKISIEHKNEAEINLQFVLASNMVKSLLRGNQSLTWTQVGLDEFVPMFKRLIAGLENDLYNILMHHASSEDEVAPSGHTVSALTGGNPPDSPPTYTGAGPFAVVANSMNVSQNTHQNTHQNTRSNNEWAMSDMGEISRYRCNAQENVRNIIQGQLNQEGVTNDILNHVAEMIRMNNNHPVISMQTHAHSTKLRNYVNNVTRNSLRPRQINLICRWLINNPARWNPQHAGAPNY